MPSSIPNDPPWVASTQVFTSALPTHSVQRRNRPGSSSENRLPPPELDPWSNGWQDREPEDIEDVDDRRIASSSRSRSRERTPPGSRIQGFASLFVHPLSPGTSPTPRSRHSHEEASPVSGSTRLSRRRGASGSNNASPSKDPAWDDLSDLMSRDKGKGKMKEEQREVIVHEVRTPPHFNSNFQVAKDTHFRYCPATLSRG